MMQCYVISTGNDTELYVLTEDTGERGEGEPIPDHLDRLRQGGRKHRL